MTKPQGLPLPALRAGSHRRGRHGRRGRPALRTRGVPALALLLLLPLLTVTAATPDESAAGDPGVVPESIGAMRLEGLSEKRFNPLRGTLQCLVTGTTLSDRPDAASVLLNGTPVSADEVTVTREQISVEYTLAEGLNEIQVMAFDRDDGLLTADLLAWAGSATLIVDVVDSQLIPVDGARVTLQLADNTIVRQGATSRNGTARFEFLPPLPVIVHATLDGSGSVRRGTHGHAGSLLLQLEVPPQK